MIDEALQLQLRARFNPEGSLLRQHQLRMLEMLRYIDEVCQKHCIKYWLCSGTLIGAARHGGFIPWDDDLDIEMLRDDYEKFVKAMQQEKSSQYVFQTHQTDFDYLAPYGKLRDLYSCIKEDNYNDWYYKYQGVYIDVFIMEPSSSLFLYKCSSVLQDYVLFRMNPHIKNKTLRSVYFSSAYFVLYHIVFPVIRCFSKVGARNQLRHTLGSYFPKSRDKNDIFPLSQMNFEGYMFPVPGDTDSYLRKIYGDYMRLPDLNSIKVHTTNVEFYK